MSRILVPLNVADMERAIASYVTWYSAHRPHEGLRGATPLEAVTGAISARDGVRLEVRKRYSIRRKSTADPPRKRVRHRLEATVAHVDGVRHLPIIGLRRAA
ncbi:MAG: hypothetical protein JNJ54_19195 [Myxococcaceae bacterium]|nr:hypothetical protein [Myxococcaceae bacterium]